MTTLTEFKEIEAKATKGPWRVEPVEGYCDDYILTDHPDFRPTGKEDRWKNFVAETTLAAGHPKQNFTNDSAFIAISRSALPALIAVAEGMALALVQYQATRETIETADNTSQHTGGSGLEIVGGPATKALAAYEAWKLNIEGERL